MELNKNETITEIDPNYELQKDDNIILVGSKKNISKFEKIINKKETKK